MPQVQGIKAAAVVVYRKALITQVEDPVNSGEMRYHRLIRHWRAFLKGKQDSKKTLTLDATNGSVL